MTTITKELAEEMIEALKDTTTSLIAAVSLLEHGGKKAAPSDKMFTAMIADYKKAIAKAQKVWMQF